VCVLLGCEGGGNRLKRWGRLRFASRSSRLSLSVKTDHRWLFPDSAAVIFIYPGTVRIFPPDLASEVLDRILSRLPSRVLAFFQYEEQVFIEKKGKLEIYGYSKDDSTYESNEVSLASSSERDEKEAGLTSSSAFLPES
jgi:hypothetical protein